ncbi:MAG: radical SAM protein [Magnetococcales bacterium]|nr:SPASM domain-containing protein [Magnetococcales bacterium]NGZ05758.1 radical SAM protein [Magnetococcales bacterium]
MTVKRAKTEGLFEYATLTDRQQKNAALNREEQRQTALTLRSVPQRLVFELTNACNLDCIMCGRDGFKQTFFDIRMLDKFVEILPEVGEVTLFGWGEPTLHPRFLALLEFFTAHPVRKYFVTNGTRLSAIQEALFTHQVDLMAVSLDGARAATNDRIRVRADFAAIIANLTEVVQRRQQLGLSHPYINFVMTLMRSNLEELPELVDLAARIGIEEVKAVYLTAFSPEMVSEVLLNEQAWVSAVFAEAIRRGEARGVTLKLPYIQGQDSAGEAAHKPCYVGWRDLFLGSDGYVRPCQSTAMKLFHFEKYPTFARMWNSEEYQDFRRRVNDPDTMPEECRRCYQSSHANWNRPTSFVQTGIQFAPTWERPVNRTQG